ncbi:SanA/YdcF family protein [Actinomadura scrupuli]|uniref:SanA/YdcF family protein n=1 Tax=Actinomadura scrupuli TaxID=559629 RepID=UPI003D9668FB
MRLGRLARGVRRGAGPLAVLAGLGSYAVAAPTAWMYADTAPYRLTAATVPAAPVAIVLGAGLEGARPSPFLAGRLRTTADLYRRGKVRVILVTGDNSRKSYDEPSAMRDFLVAEGVPADRIVLDYAGFDTWDSCARAKEIFGVRRAIVVTQKFHLPRAVALCRSVGIEAYGVGHDTYPIDGRTTTYGYAREVVASIKAVGDLVAHPRPRFLGPREPGVERALTR